MRRLSHGAPIREAMKAAGLSIPRLAAETKRLDPERGLSASYIGFVVGQGSSSREECSERAAALIAEVLGKPVTSFFEEDCSPMPSDSTSTDGDDEVRTAPPNIEVMLTVAELAGVIKKSPSWIWSKLRDRETNEFPVHYVGVSPRFFFSEVRAWFTAQAVQAGRAA